MRFLANARNERSEESFKTVTDDNLFIFPDTHYS